MKNRLIRMLALMLVLCACLPLLSLETHAADNDTRWTDFAATSFASGSGTAADPYVIKTAEQLALLARYTNVQKWGYYDAHYVLGADIDLSGRQWIPIGVVEGAEEGLIIGFEGVFDGRNHCISGLTITQPIEDCSMYGLFGMHMGTIKNLKLSKAKICFNSAEPGWISANGMGSDIEVGVLCADAVGDILNCDVVNGTVDVTAVMSLQCGGAVGCVSDAKISDVHVTGTSVSGNSGRAIWVGGCIGIISNDTVVDNSGFIGNIKSQNNGTIELEGLTEEGYSYVHYAGGFCGSAGRANSNICIKNCYADAKINSVSLTAQQDVGGFAGAIGVIYDSAIYQNLVCRPVITCNGTKVAIDETYFWRGELGTWYSSQKEDSEIWSYKNLTVLTGDTAYVTNSLENYCETTTYNQAAADISKLIFDKLGFSKDIWMVASDGMPKVKNIGVDTKEPVQVPSISVTNVASTGKIKLTWNKTDGAVKYQVYRATSKTGTYSLLKTLTGTSLTNTSVDVGKTYYYKVRAVDAAGNKSEWSNIVSRTCDLPRPVVKVTNVASTGKIKLTWEKVDGATKYEIYRATSKDGTYIKLSTTTNTTLTNTSTTAGTTYYYKVKAIHSNSAANSAYSSVVSRTCDLPQPKVTVTNVASTGKVKLSWTAVEGAAKYEVYRATSKDGTYTKLSTTTNTTLTNTSTTAGTTYYYKVKAIHSNSAANSAYSSIVSRTCDLAQPTLTVKLNSSGKPVLTWTKVEGAVSYKVYRAISKDGTYSLVKTLTGTTLTNTSVTAGKTYYYKVIAVHSNTAANSAYSAIKSVTVK